MYLLAASSWCSYLSLYDARKHKTEKKKTGPCVRTNVDKPPKIYWIVSTVTDIKTSQIPSIRPIEIVIVILLLYMLKTDIEKFFSVGVL